MDKKDKKENTIISLKYFNNIKNFNDLYLNYLKAYHSISKEYHTKIYNLQKENSTKTKEIISKLDKDENTDFSQIINFVNVIPKIIDLYLENLGYLLKDLEKEMKSYRTFLKEKEMLINKFKAQFEEAKNDYIKKENEMNKLKNSFMNNMTSLEQNIYNFYSAQNEKSSSKKIIDKKKNVININLNIKNTATMDQINSQINNTQKLEKNYKEIIESTKIFQDNFIQSESSSSENIKNIILDISLQLKQSIMNILMPIKNNLKIPETEIDNCLPELITADGKKNIEIAMKNYFENNIIQKKVYVPKKYELQVLKTEFQEEDKNKNNNNNKFLKINFRGNKTDLTKGEKKVSTFEDGLEEMHFINDEYALFTTKKIMKNFQLINSKGFDIQIEEEKTTAKKLSMKIVFNFKKSKKKASDKKENINIEKNNSSESKDNLIIDDDKIDNDNNDEFVIIDTDKDLISITEEEAKLFEILLDKHYNRIIFMQILNEFRTTGKLEIPKKVYEIVGKLFNIILGTVKRDNDIHTGRNVILLSQTYYTMENEKKKYVQDLLINNELFKDMTFWEDLLDLELSKEIKRTFMVEENNNKNFDVIINLNPHKFDNLAFSQILTISDNMISFGLDKETIYKLMEPKFKSFKLSEQSIETIKNILESRYQEREKEKKE